MTGSKRHRRHVAAPGNRRSAATGTGTDWYRQNGMQPEDATSRSVACLSIRTGSLNDSLALAWLGSGTPICTKPGKGRSVWWMTLFAVVLQRVPPQDGLPVLSDAPQCLNG